MESPGPNENRFERESSVYYIVFRLPLGLIVFWLLLPLLARVAPVSPVAGVAYFLLLAMPYVLVFVTGILSIWGISLICLRLRQSESVLGLTLATIASSLTFLLFLGLLVFIYV